MQQAVICLDQIAVSFRLGHRCEELVPKFWKHVACSAVVVPVDLAATKQEDAPQNQMRDAMSVALGVHER
ncbi:hypothetical protein BJF84_02675 [Rhodococcus sp. CUA-806]|nr:hypothetical protein BJF84_02675 [Rhodococcus sp. CUA-806]